MALGKVSKGKAIRRSGARVRDDIFLTGPVGGSALGLALLKKGWPIKAHQPPGKNVTKKECRESQKAVQKHCQPLPHLKEGRFFSQGNLAHAMIDISDGLSSDLHNLCQASKVGAVIYESSIPLDQSLRTFVKDRRKALKMGLSGGEDYCLMLTVSRQRSLQAARKFQRRFSRPLFKIGEIVPKKEGIRLVTRQGKMRMLSRSGYEHFKKSFQATGLSLGSF
jgi:thiamine-monophosphate kinase